MSSAEFRYADLHDQGKNLDMRRDVLIHVPTGEGAIGLTPEEMKSFLQDAPVLQLQEMGLKVRLHHPYGKVVTIEEYLNADRTHAASEERSPADQERLHP